MILYLTADEVGAPSGGGAVTFQEHAALAAFAGQRLRERRNPRYSQLKLLSRAELASSGPDPWKWDQRALELLKGKEPPLLCHVYSGTWPLTAAWLKEQKCIITQTIAAHDKDVSRKEHEKLGWPFELPHLAQPKLWQRYIEGYRLADLIICPSLVAEKIVRGYGPAFAKKRILVIPHGCHLPEEIKPLPRTFVTGYLGSWGCDKGIRYLLEAWKSLNYKDDSLLLLGGKDSTTPMARHLLSKYGGGSVHIAGWQAQVGNFYNQLSLLVQPSATEGFGLEVLEALSYGRPVLCSMAAGAQDLVPDNWCFPACNAERLAQLIAETKRYLANNVPTMSAREIAGYQKIWSDLALPYSWDKIRVRYQEAWGELLP